MNRRRKTSLDNRVDYGMMLPVFLLSLIGMLSLHVVLYNDPSKPEIGSLLMRQGLWHLIEGLSIVIIVRFNSKLLWWLTPIFCMLELVSMGLPLKFYDPVLAGQIGSKNWTRSNNTTFQPLELMKIAFTLMLAYIVTMRNAKYVDRMLKSDFWLIVKMLLAAIPVTVLVLSQKDFGTMLVFLAIFGGVFLVSGITWKIIVPVFILAALMGTGTICLITTETGGDLSSKLGIEAYKFDRIDLWLNPLHTDPDRSFQSALALTTIGSGGLFGKGFNASDIYVPIREPDMVSTIVGENFGFIDGCFIILLYFILIYRMIHVCFDTNNEFYAYIVTGTIMMILFRVFENTGANAGLLPLTGIPLPFINQGGSSILDNTIGVGLTMPMRY